jgi:2-iminobutanoate/2-iminopropanoate deaminase
MKEIIHFPNIKNADYSYNNVVQEGNKLYLTSQLSCDLKTGKIIPGNIELQTKNALENIKYLLENSNSSLENILQVRIYLKDVTEFERMEKVYRTYFKRGNEPARVTIQAQSPIKDINVEIEAIAVINE